MLDCQSATSRDSNSLVMSIPENGEWNWCQRPCGKPVLFHVKQEDTHSLKALKQEHRHTLWIVLWMLFTLFKWRKSNLV